ncbi:MAG: hypothetical protein KDC98_13725, partial [Planctomycetes bacterium]|nr:hypothetical protein [Planctomycetota bacterium]
EEATFLAEGFDPQAAGWKRLLERGSGLDLNRAVSTESPMLAYLLVIVHADSARTAQVLLGSDDGVRVWLNGELRHSHDLHRHLAADEDRFEVPLRAGPNRFLIKVKNDFGGYGVMLRICDPTGTLRIDNEVR